MLELEKRILRELTVVETNVVGGGTGAGCYPPDTTTTITTTDTTMTTTTITTDTTLTTLTTTNTLTS